MMINDIYHIILSLYIFIIVIPEMICLRLMQLDFASVFGLQSAASVPI